jgi:hypothetical protein
MLTSFCCISSQAIVFVVGGGNYIEYQNLMDYSKVCRISGALHFFLLMLSIFCIPPGIISLQTSNKTAPKRIIYGSTDLVGPNEFLSQLTRLGEQQL